MTHIFGGLHNAMYKLYDYNANKLKYDPTPHLYMISVMVSVELHPSSFIQYSIARFLIRFYINTIANKVSINSYYLVNKHRYTYLSQAIRL